MEEGLQSARYYNQQRSIVRGDVSRFSLCIIIGGALLRPGDDKCGRRSESLALGVGPLWTFNPPGGSKADSQNIPL